MFDKEIEIIKIVDLKKCIIKTLTESSKKGENGCIAIIGGSFEYTALLIIVQFRL